jgi:hypothetical protein
MALPLTSTRYILTTDDLLAGWDQKYWLQAADDSQLPDSSVSSFQELADAATSGGSGSDAEKVRDQIIAVLSEEARKAESWLESFCTGVYIIPLQPCDGVAKDLILDYMVHRMKIRHDMYRNPDTQLQAENGLINRGKYIRNEMNRLTSARPGAGQSLNESIAAFGGDSRRDLCSGPFNGPRTR